jgi:hypothetical protein
MNVIQTAANGVVNEHTIFSFSQNNDLVQATYSGGKIRMGFLVGILQKDKLSFSYCQLQLDGKLDNGRSECNLEIGENGKVRLIEHFTFTSRNEEAGINVFQEL